MKGVKLKWKVKPGSIYYVTRFMSDARSVKKYTHKDVEVESGTSLLLKRASSADVISSFCEQKVIFDWKIFINFSI